ncbi:MAG: hypothetical protein ACRD39_02055 [Nitrososphaeraceae archaeon]
MLSVKPGDQVLDLGCGLGAMLVFLSRYPIKVTGIDIVKVFCVLSRLRLYLLPFRKARTSVINKDFRFISFNNFTIIYAFLVPDALAVLRPKFEAEMRDEALLITYKCPALLSTELFDQSVFEEQPNSFFFFYRKKAIVLNR